MTPGQWGALPLGLAIVVYGLLGRHVPATVLLAGLAGLAALTRARLSLGLLGHGLLVGATSFAAFLAYGVLISAGAQSSPLPTPWAVAAFCCLLYATLRRLTAEPPAWPLLTYGLGLAALLSCGQVRVGPAYGAAVFAYLVLTLLALRAEDRGRPSWSRLSRRGRIFSVVLPLVSAGVALGLNAPLYPLQEWVQRRFDNAFDDETEARVGFHDVMSLGEMRGMLDSDRVVLRIFGGRPDYLRGAVYNHYRDGHWDTVRNVQNVRIEVGKGAPPAGVATIELHAVNVEPNRFFLPMEVAALWTPSGRPQVDNLGVFIPDEGVIGWTIYLQPGPRALAPISPPQQVDDRVPAALREPLAAQAAAWVGDAQDPAERLARIERHLRTGYRYSLHYRRSRKLDPVLDFLTLHPEGHCEYFASAMALLSRSVGVPARVVSGYRVKERSRLLGYYVVRERNAHAWVEAFLPGRGWTVYDPTPPSEGGQPDAVGTSLGGAVLDLLKHAAGTVASWFGVLGGWKRLALILAGVLTLRLLWRRFWSRVRRRTSGPPEVALSPPLPGFVALSQALSRGGIARQPGETLERFAARVTDAEARALLQAYAALRYGGQGEESALSTALFSCARRLSSAREGSSRRAVD